MENTEIEYMYAEMIGKLREINGPEVNTILDFSTSLAICQEALSMLRTWFEENRLAVEAQEIHFFKYVKPRFLCWQIYVTKLYEMSSMAPGDGEKALGKYYRRELKVIDRFFKRYATHYQYYLTDDCSRDEFFFLRRNAGGESLELAAKKTSTGFVTRFDGLFAKFRALEILRQNLVDNIRDLRNRGEIRFLEKELQSKKRHWTGSKVELIELAYGLYHTRRINGGKAELREIIAWLEESLHVDLQQPYRTFVDITRRKLVSRTQFLEEMQTSLDRYIKEELWEKLDQCS